MSVKTIKSTTASSVKASARRRPGKQWAHVKFFQIGVLELERLRKEKDRQLALEKIAAADQRLAEISREIRELFAEIVDRPATEALSGEPSSAAIPGSPAQGFNIKY